MTPESNVLLRGIPTPPDEVASGDYVQVTDNDTTVTGYVEMRDGALACIAEHSGVTYFLDARDCFVRMLRPRGVLPDGAAVWFRLVSERGAEQWFKAKITRHYYVGVKPRYNVDYQSADFEGAYDEAAAVHAEDIELREANPHSDTSINPHLMHEQSTTLREIGELAVRQGANPARAAYDQVVEAFSLTEQRATTAGEEVGRGKLRREIEQLLTNYDAPKPDHWGIQRGDVMEWLSRALQVGRGHARERYALAGELTRLGAPPELSVTQMVEFVIAKTRAEARANATRAAEEAASTVIEDLKRRRHEHECGEQQAREALADTERQHQELFRLLSYAEPAPHGVDLVERLSEVMEAFRARIKALAVDNQTLIEQQGDGVPEPDKIREHALEAMSVLAKRIPGIQGFTLPQKLREVLAYYDNRISELELAVVSRSPKTVIAGTDRVRAVVDRAIENGPAELTLTRDLGGWFLRALANANLAVIVYNWDGIDPVAEPVEPTAAPPAPPTLDDVKAAWGDMVTQIAKVPQVLRDALKDLP